MATLDIFIFKHCCQQFGNELAEDQLIHLRDSPPNIGGKTDPAVWLITQIENKPRGRVWCSPISYCPWCGTKIHRADP